MQDQVLNREISTKISSEYQANNTFSQEYLIQICQDLLKSHQLLSSQQSNFKTLSTLINESIQVNLIDNISKQQLHINRLQNIKKS